MRTMKKYNHTVSVIPRVIILVLVFALTSTLMLYAYHRPSGTEAADLKICMMNGDDNLSGLLTSAASDCGITADIRQVVTDYEMDAGDARKKINLELMSSTGPDILILDDMDPTPYIKSGKLLDLRSIARDSGVPAEVKQQFTSEDKCFALPAAQTLFVYAADGSAGKDLPNTSGFGTLLRFAQKNNLYFGNAYDNIAAIACRLYVEPRLTGVRSSDRRLLRDFYQSLQRLRGQSRQKYEAASFQRLNMQLNPLFSFEGIGHGGTGVSMDYLCSIEDFQLLQLLSDKDRLRYRLAEENGRIISMPCCIVAVNKNGAHRSTAVKYLRYLMSEEGQRLVSDSSLLPSDLNSLSEIMRRTTESDRISEYNTLTLPALRSRTVRLLTRDLGDRLTSRVTDGVLMDIVMTEANEYINGNQTLDAAVERAVNRIRIVRSE